MPGPELRPRAGSQSSRAMQNIVQEVEGVIGGAVAEAKKVETLHHGRRVLQGVWVR
jgi:hypothetical protein